MKVWLLTSASILLTSVVIGNAYYQKKQFYPTVVYITKSNPCLAVLALQSLIVVLFSGRMMCKLFFGQLRPAEVEHLIEKSWYAVTETCLAFTVFREDFSTSFVAMFTLLLYLKCFHWLVEDRVDYMERSPALGCLFHLRVTVLLGLLAVADAYFVQHAYLSTISKGATAQVVFGFEYAILVVAVFMTFCKYALHTLDMQHDTPWENKAVLLLHLELVTSCAKLILYLVFVGIMIRVHTFPLFAVRPLYLTLRAFKKAASDVVLSRRAIRHMNTLYPDATAEELHAGDVCIICREEMAVGCKKLPCGHIFHASCLRSWFQRQQTCPTCRLEVLRTRPTTAAAAAAQAVRPGAAAGAAQAPPGAGPVGAAPPLNAAAFAQWQAMFAVMPPMPWLPAAGAAPHAGVQQQQQQARDAAVAGPAAAPSGAAAGQQQQQAAGASSSTAAPSSAAAAGGAAGAAATSTPTVHAFPGQQGVVWPAMSPNPFAMPFGLLPPMPPMPRPDSLSRLSVDELRQLEGSERAQLEARVRWLRDIQTLLDAAVEQMAQYVAVTSSLSTLSSTLPTASSPAARVPGSPATDVPNGQASNPSQHQNGGTHSAGGLLTPIRESAQLSDPGPSAASQASSADLLAEVPPAATEESIPRWADPREEEYRDETQEVRRRRLQRLEREAAAQAAAP